MLVVEPSSLRFEEESLSGAESAGLLAERVSVLENNLTRFAEKLERTLDLMLKQVQSAHVDHLLLDTLIAILTEAKAIDGSALAKRWRGVMEKEGLGRGGASSPSPPSSPTPRFAEARDRIVAAYSDSPRNKAAFVKFVDEGFNQRLMGESEKGFKALERAVALAPRNLPLQAVLGEHFFREGKSALALLYLEAACSLGGDSRLRLWLGLTLADEGAEVARGRELIAGVAAECAQSFAVQYALGRLAAAEGDWATAAAEFKKALASNVPADAYYVHALAQYQLGRLRVALRHASRALELDENFEQAFRLLGLIHKRLGDAARSRDALRRANALRRARQRIAPPGARTPRASDELLLHEFFGASRETGKALRTGGDARLAESLRADALAYESPAR
jgi:tetratricopeptide (TPR) repeat protein